MKIRQKKKRIFAGAVCEQIVYTPESGVKANGINPKPRFKDDAERKEYLRRESRRHHALMINANYGPSSYFVTLTFDMENECHDFEEARILRDRYYRKLYRKNPEAKINIYMGKGKNTNRIHLHMIIDGVQEKEIKSLWTYGEINRIEHLREHNYDHGVDMGRDYTALANYCFDHWTQEQGTGKRYKQSRTVKQPEVEKATECKREYTPDKPPKPPKGYKYIGCTWNRYGFILFKYVLIPPPDEKRKHTRTINQYC